MVELAQVQIQKDDDLYEHNKDTANFAGYECVDITAREMLMFIGSTTSRPEEYAALKANLTELAKGQDEPLDTMVVMSLALKIDTFDNQLIAAIPRTNRVNSLDPCDTFLLLHPSVANSEAMVGNNKLGTALKDYVVQAKMLQNLGKEKVIKNNLKLSGNAFDELIDKNFKEINNILKEVRQVSGFFDANPPKVSAKDVSTSIKEKGFVAGIGERLDQVGFLATLRELWNYGKETLLGSNVSNPTEESQPNANVSNPIEESQPNANVSNPTQESQPNARVESPKSVSTEGSETQGISVNKQQKEDAFKFEKKKPAESPAKLAGSYGTFKKPNESQAENADKKQTAGTWSGPQGRGGKF